MISKGPKMADQFDEQAGRAGADALSRGEEELLSSEDAKALLAAPTALFFWREKRGLDRARLGRALGIDEQRLAEIETGTAEAPLGIYRKAAELLGISLDDLATD